MTTELLEIASQAPSNLLTDLESETINNQLDSAIKSKIESGELLFAPAELESGINPNSQVDISRFGSLGLQDPDDLRQFLLTEAGKTVIHEIADEIILEKAQEEELEFEIQQQILEKQRIQALLFHWLLDEEEEAKKAQAELIAEQQQQVHEYNEQHNTPPTSAPKKETNDILKGYSESIDKCSSHQKTLGERIDKLEKERKLLGEKYEAYEKGFTDFDNEAHEFENGTKDIDKEIDRLKEKADKTADKMSKTGDEEKLHNLANKLNNIGFKIANLENIRSVKNGEKQFADADGNFKDKEGNPITFKNAAFVLSHDQKIEKENGHYYLLDKDQSLADMDEKTKETAQKNYEHSKKDLQLVKHLVQDVKKNELHLNATQLAKHKAEHQMLQQNIISLQKAAHEYAKKGAQKHPQLSSLPSSKTPDNVSSLNPQKISKPERTPPQKRSAQEVLGNYIKNSPKPMTWGLLVKFVNDIPNSQTRNKASKFLNDSFEKDQNEQQEQNDNPNQPKQKESLAVILRNPEKFKRWLTSTLSAAPVPDATMQDLLKNMASNGQDPYDKDVTSEISPAEMREEPQPRTL